MNRYKRLRGGQPFYDRSVVPIIKRSVYNGGDGDGFGIINNFGDGDGDGCGDGNGCGEEFDSEFGHEIVPGYEVDK